MRLDHLLSREEVRVVLLLICEGADRAGEIGEGSLSVGEGRKSVKVRRAYGSSGKESGGDAFMGNTRSHPEHEG